MSTMKKILAISLLVLSFPIVGSAVSYTKTLVQVPVAHGDTVPGYLLVPDATAELSRANGTEHGLPAIVALHDHGAWFTIGKEKLTSPCPLTGKGCPQDGEGASEACAWINKFYEGQFVADTLASRGYVVLVIDALYWGERPPSPLKGGDVNTLSVDSLKRLNKRLKNEQPEFYQAYLEKTGEVWFERILADDKACVDYLMSLPYVDKERIGVWGFSMGAYRAWQLAAEDSRIAFCAAANWMQRSVTETNSHAETVPETNSDAAQSWQLKNVSSWSMYRPSKDSTTYAAIASRIAPRPFLLQYGMRDKLFPDPVLKEGQWPQLTIQAIDSEHRFTRTHLQLLLEWLRNL